jgi:hypothetical protein
VPSVLIHKVSEMKPEMRAALEAELGRPLSVHEDVSIMAFEAHPAPVGEARSQAANVLQEHFDRIDQKTKEIPEEEVEETLDEALRSVRPRYRERE